MRFTAPAGKRAAACLVPKLRLCVQRMGWGQRTGLPHGCDTGDTSLSWPRLLGGVVWLRGPEKHGLKVPCCSPTVRQDGDMVKFNAVCDL